MKIFIIGLVAFLIIPAVASAEVPQVEVRNFTITGYYSPLPGQDYFLTGSYESEIRLNGNGTHGADGTPVYPGMIAAPKSYNFGTKVCLPGFGCGTVHDRGGAIVEQGERDLARHDRLDLWMGYGMEGMQRALAWGVQHVEGQMYPVGSDVADTANFSVPLPLTQLLELPRAEVFSKNLSTGSTGDEVERAQTALRRLGIFEHSVTGKFGAETESAVREFQLKFFVIDSPTSVGAGVLGPRTRAKLTQELARIETQKKIQELWDSFEFEAGMSRGSRTGEVVKLQQVLVQQELMEVAPTGYFGPITETALIEFQLRHGIIASKFEAGAGRVGEATQAKLNELLVAERAVREMERREMSELQQSRAKLAVLESGVVRQQLAAAIGTDEATPELLQNVLTELGYYTGPITGKVGPLTRRSLLRFQLDHAVIPSATSVGAGVFGPGTRARLAEVIRG